jgi:beta-N-acetylhexosaminidase
MNEAGLRRATAGTLLTSFRGDAVPAWLLRRVEHGAGGVCLYGSNRHADFPAVSDQLRRARQPVVVACDEEGGDVTRLEALTGSSVPGNAALGAADDPALTRKVAGALGAALAEAGIDLDLAPCADVNSNPANPVIGVRSFGADPALVARHTVAFIAGLHDAGVASCVKHFPGHGDVDVDSHERLPVLDVPVAVLRDRELVPFRAAIDAGVDAVMPGHLLVPALDARPATISAEIVSGVLRDLGFVGAVITDALDMGGIAGAATIPQNVVAALAAGADLCCLGPDNDETLFDASVQAVMAAISTGELAEERVVEAAGRAAALWRRSLAGDRAAGTGEALADVGAEAAAVAARIDGTVPRPMTGAHVVELDRRENIAAGTVPWGLGEALLAIDPTATVTRLGPADNQRLGDVLEAAIGSPLVLVVRDAYRIPALAEAADIVLTARPDAVVVDMGWPSERTSDDSIGPAARLVTYGASRASARAAAALLAQPATQPRLSERTSNG